MGKNPTSFEDDLAIVVDATYNRLEKSANNQFQYKYLL